MRIIPILTAIIVTVALYFAVMERDKLVAFATGAPADGNATDAAAAAPAPEASAPARPLVRVFARHSKAQVIDSAVVLRGETQAARSVELRAETAGQVVSEPLRKGSFVQEGQVLCQIDAGTRPAMVAEARARLVEARARVPEAAARVAQARAQLKEAELNRNAASKLSKDGFASETRLAATEATVSGAKAAVETALSGLETVQANIQSAEAALASAEKELERLEIKASFAGLLESDTAELGSLLQPGGLCATVIQLDPIKLVGYAPEAQVGRIEVGALAGARLSDGRELRGRVTFLSRRADDTTRTFRLEIEVPNADLSVRDGQTAELLIASDGAKAHLLPQSTLTLNDDGVLGVRLVGDGNLTVFAPVQLLRDTVQGVWVTGLPDAADVITVGQEYVVEGVEVAPSFQEPM
ncbi:MAG: efflux RND transporter periplasmic adaptor subunit [Lutimaribacter sp.]